MSIIQSPKVALTVPGLATLSNGNYAISAAASNASGASDIVVEVSCAAIAAPNGNKQIMVFAKSSLDGVTFSGSAVTATTCEEASEKLLGVLPVTAAGQTFSKAFSLKEAFGFTPSFYQIIVKNDLSASLSSGTISEVEMTDTESGAVTSVLSFSTTATSAVSTLSGELPKSNPTLQATATFTGAGTASVTIDWYGSNEVVTPAVGNGVKFATSVLGASPAGSAVKDTTGATSTQQWAYVFCIISNATYGGTSALTAGNLRITVGA
jgi:hypothetical protein